MTRPTHSPGGPVEDLDELLTAYFQAKMPNPWPAFRGPARINAFAPRRRWLASSRSRLALAASIALLIAGATLLSGAFRSVHEPPAASSGIPTAGRDFRSEIFLEQSPDGPTTIKINIEEAPVAR